ncbi:hypothetical protein A3G67_03825 [Candidatus Roizmanbacteria bacterium RIFCSPLOWO2_12_FULL_40_12]|uniref:Uncharacterized protein n=1 Tax=Candidatus Roizmanbacteria bacterium RIFCSPLOWO2_01_FULL_40_42 TaxID=1802066 RepID=A0A1F7J5R7_9BACT|nr:MAG: hypothetical protein A2779_03460 [Candidatus Roizmanbacteria bacterium RIFCSPHIGHO2_01_FULL_40_98]OGK28393.1 MAG: hypothetical protein A3C31_00825 [Candidatus Roizmanbacteria bacterium RIFCSPHIGHO2_02_FULL_40_53]OGK30629.1 MAG: hypothetical protein A2W49_03510 [Candidatus Roizmanbacteria bacterium RIFCSPHIGHO2_12_41_18]OGK35957.1 MAG: hypothetical protein A3E69_03195 [Candidatus Roizmanbacteria bacterium RIFCSPHIGHO2_12_FULL_40_130]OGK50949.1 MAG: hypothetical protein A3B50_01595 [Candi
MADEKRPTIKGIFVKSHIKAVFQKAGKEGVELLQKKYGKSLQFRNSESVPIREEVKIIELSLDILEPDFTGNKKFEAGRLHFRNFATTPLANIIFSAFKKNFKLMMMQSPNIAGHVFQGVRFVSEDLGEKAVKVIMENNDYPIEHFGGLFYEWMLFAGYEGTVEQQSIGSDKYAYIMKWK